MLGARERQNDRLATELAAAQRRIGELEAKLVRSRSHDAVAEDLMTVQAFRVQLELEVKRSSRYRRPLTLVLLDIDDFRKLNLRGGMARGDALLKGVARLITEQTRVNDLACRLGGDEFGVLMPETAVDGALVPVRRILEGMASIDAGGLKGHSASIGVAGLEQDQGPEELLASARSGLEKARGQGGGNFAVNSTEGAGSEARTIAAHGDVVAVLAAALVERDRNATDHSESLVELAAKVATSLGLEPDAIANVRTAALLHDIGKIAIPDGVIRKKGPLDEGEWAMMRQHPLIGERILRAIPGMGAVARVVRHEHERWDGCGYPDGMSAAEIPIGSRIVLACDAYQAMTSERPYREALSHADAVAELSANAGTQFDPEVVECLIGILFGRGQAGPAG